MFPVKNVHGFSRLPQFRILHCNKLKHISLRLMLIFYGLSRNLSYELEVIEAQFLRGLFGSGTEKKKILHFVTQLATFCKLV